MKLNFAFISLIASAMLIGCGGGGGGGEPSPPPADVTYQLWNAFVNSAKEAVSREFTASGTVSGFAVTASGSVAGQPLRAGSFEGRPALIKDTATAGTLTINGQTLPIIGLTSAFLDPNYLPLGMASDGEYDVVTGTPSFPQLAKVNESTLTRTYRLQPEGVMVPLSEVYSSGADVMNSQYGRVL